MFLPSDGQRAQEVDGFTGEMKHKPTAAAAVAQDRRCVGGGLREGFGFHAEQLIRRTCPAEPSPILLPPPPSHVLSGVNSEVLLRCCVAVKNTRSICPTSVGKNAFFKIFKQARSFLYKYMSGLPTAPKKSSSVYPPASSLPPRLSTPDAVPRASQAASAALDPFVSLLDVLGHCLMAAKKSERRKI